MEKERYEEVVYQYSDMVTRIAVMNVKNYDDAKDCYQNVFMLSLIHISEPTRH
mgnify:CR=1 FL=1